MYNKQVIINSKQFTVVDGCTTTGSENVGHLTYKYRYIIIIV